jgi:hypothetical protein
VDEGQGLVVVPEDVLPAPKGSLVAKSPETHTHTHTSAQEILTELSDPHRQPIVTHQLQQVQHLHKQCTTAALHHIARIDKEVKAHGGSFAPLHVRRKAAVHVRDLPVELRAVG